MYKKIFIFFGILTFLLLVNNFVSAKPLKKRYSQNKDICQVVKDTIQGGGNSEEIIIGAIGAGATSDVVSRCAVDAGVEPDKIAKIFEREGLPGLGYTPRSQTRGPRMIHSGFPGGKCPGCGGGFISPSSF